MDFKLHVCMCAHPAGLNFLAGVEDKGVCTEGLPGALGNPLVVLQLECYSPSDGKAAAWKMGLMLTQQSLRTLPPPSPLPVPPFFSMQVCWIDGRAGKIL